MSTPSSCCDPCATVPPVNVPGAPGNDGAPGVNGSPGIDAFTTVISPGFIIPPVMNSVTIPVANTSWMTVGQVIVIQGPVNFRVTSITSPTSLIGQFLKNPGDLPSGSIGAGATVSASGYGESAFTFTTADFIIPPVGGTVNPVFVIQSDWMSVGIPVYIAGDWFEVASITSLTQVGLTYSNVTTNVNAGNNVVSGSKIVTAGHNGENAYTLIIAPTVATPFVGSNVTVNVVNSDWMVVGENVIVGDVGWGVATFQVVSLPTPQSAQLKFLGYPNDVASGITMTAGSRVAVCGLLYTNETHVGYAAGTSYVLTTTPGILALGTLTPTMTLGGPGTYLIMATAQYSYQAYNGGNANPPVVTTLLSRSNNTPASIANSSTAWVGTTADYSLQANVTAHYTPLPFIVYVTATTGDVIEVWGSYSGTMTGAIAAIEANIVAVKLAP